MVIWETYLATKVIGARELRETDRYEQISQEAGRNCLI